MAPCSRASFGSSRSGFPRTTTSLPSSDARSSRRQSNRNAVRLGRGVEQPVLEHEHRHDPLVRVQRRAQRRVVVQAQVAPEPHERGVNHLVGYGRGPRLDPRGTGPRLPAVPARDRRPAERTGAVAHLRGALQGDDGALPRGGVGVRDRLARRRRPAPDRLRVRDRRGAGADARRPAEPGRARHAAVPDRGAPGRAGLSRRASWSSSTTATRTSTRRPRRARTSPTPTSSSRRPTGPPTRRRSAR